MGTPGVVDAPAATLAIPRGKSLTGRRRKPRHYKLLGFPVEIPATNVPAVEPYPVADPPVRRRPIMGAVARHLRATHVTAGHRHLRDGGARRGGDGAPARRGASPRGCRGWWPSRTALRCCGYRVRRPLSDARPAYRFCVADSGLRGPRRPRSRRRPAGCWPNCWRAAQALGARQMLAVIGDSANTGSIGVHRALGFERMRRAGGGRLEVRSLARRGADAARAWGRCGSTPQRGSARR